MPQTTKTAARVAEKRVRITLEISSTFVGMLLGKVNLHYLERNDEGPPTPKGRLDPAGVLAVLVLAEARGMSELQTAMCVPPEWRPDIDVVSELRQVYQNGKLIAGPIIQIVPAEKKGDDDGKTQRKK